MQRRNLIVGALAAGLVPARALKASPTSLGFDEMYGAQTVLGLQFSEKMQSLAGQSVSVAGFMAPPLKADAHFLVLTKSPVSLCPFCNSDEDWPDSIIVVYLNSKQPFVQSNKPIVVTGTLELGSETDEQTGFVSLVRLVDAHYKEL